MAQTKGARLMSGATHRSNVSSHERYVGTIKNTIVSTDDIGSASLALLILHDPEGLARDTVTVEHMNDLGSRTRS